jgi:endoglucanase
MHKDSFAFLKSLLEAAGPSGDERAPAAVWRERAAGFATVDRDHLGSSTARVGPQDGPSLAVFGHIDEIGLAVMHVDDDGYVWFTGVGGWTPTVLIGQRIRILTKAGPVIGVIGKKATHLLSTEERGKPVKLDDLWIDIGAGSGEEAREHVRVGDLAVIEQPPVELLGSRIASRAVDNRTGAFAALEAVRLYAERPGRWALTAVASAREEITLGGAKTSAFRLAPDAAIAVDVTHASDYPSVSKNQLGDIRLGRGAVIQRGSGVHQAITDFLVETAEAEEIPHQLEGSGGNTGTDADVVHLSRAGIPTGLISIPCRYMHSPCEVVDVSDLESVARLIAAAARRLTDVPG